MRRLTLTARIDNFTSYGQIAIRIARGLMAHGAWVQIRALAKSQMFGSKIPQDIQERFVHGVQPEEWEIMLHNPSLMPTPGKRTLYLTMWEACRLRPVAVRFLNQATVVVTPSTWNACTFNACGVDTPIRKVPLGIDPGLFHFRRRWDTPTIDIGGRKARCVFGTAGRLAHGGVRKGVNEVIDIFREAFPTEDDVCLRVKGFPDCPIPAIEDPRIEVRREYWRDEELSDWYASLNCFVSTARAEGWGLMQHQAMAVGRPVIAPLFGGLAEFMRADCCYCPQFNLAPAESFYAGCGAWAVPDRSQVVQFMRRVYENPQEADDKGEAASRLVEPLTWDNSIAKLADVLREFGAL